MTDNSVSISKKIFMFCKLCRFHSVTLMCLFILLPIFFATNNLTYSLLQVIPFFYLISSEIVLNDLCDIEKDKINKPQRVLTEGIITKFQAKIIFLILTCIAICLAIMIYINVVQLMCFITIQIVLYFYNFPFRIIGYLKTFFTAFSVCLAIYFAFTYSSFRDIYIYLILISFFFILGRETFMDIRDKEGDELNHYYTLVSLFGERNSFYLGCIYFAICIFLSFYLAINSFNYLIFFIILLNNIILIGLINYFKINKENRAKQNEISIMLWIPMLLYLLGLGMLLWS